MSKLTSVHDSLNDLSSNRARKSTWKCNKIKRSEEFSTTCAIMNGNDIKHDDTMHSCFICQAPATEKCPFCDADVYYCCQSHFELHRSKSSSGEVQCNPFSIKFTESVGRFMVANRDIEAGETIFQDTAAVVGPAADTLPLCLNCHAKVRKENPRKNPSFRKCIFYF